MSIRWTTSSAPPSTSSKASRWAKSSWRSARPQHRRILVGSSNQFIRINRLGAAVDAKFGGGDGAACRVDDARKIGIKNRRFLRRRRAVEPFRLHPTFAFERDEVSENLARGRRPELVRNRRVDTLDDGGNGRCPGFECVQDLALPRTPMRDVLVEFGHRILDALAVSAVDAPCVRELATQPVEGRLVNAHVAA